MIVLMHRKLLGKIGACMTEDNLMENVQDSAGKPVIGPYHCLGIVYTFSKKFEELIIW